ncbi:MAG: hypothetical protein JWP57_4382, partial [Spirosoma sp.]|nr:hypothetical protein [Spirosoma sp.]
GAMSYVPAGRPDPASCYICGGPFKGGASHSARTLPGLGIVQACRPECSVELGAIRVEVVR